MRKLGQNGFNINFSRKTQFFKPWPNFPNFLGHHTHLLLHRSTFHRRRRRRGLLIKLVASFSARLRQTLHQLHQLFSAVLFEFRVLSNLFESIINREWVCVLCVFCDGDLIPPPEIAEREMREKVEKSYTDCDLCSKKSKLETKNRERERAKVNRAMNRVRVRNLTYSTIGQKLTLANRSETGRPRNSLETQYYELKNTPKCRSQRGPCLWPTPGGIATVRTHGKIQTEVGQWPRMRRDLHFGIVFSS